MVEERKKSGSGIIIVIFLIILGVGGYFVYDKSLKDNIQKKIENKNDTEENTETETSEVTISTDSILVQDLYDRIMGSRNENDLYWLYEDSDDMPISKMAENKKMLLVFWNLRSFDYKYVICNTLPLSTEQNNNNNVCSDNGGANNAISRERVEQIYKRLYGPNSKLDTSIVMPIDMTETKVFRYVSSKDSYVLYYSTQGNIQEASYSGTLIRATKTNKYLRLYEKGNIKSADGSMSEANYVYNFQLNEDGSYTYFSRKKEA